MKVKIERIQYPSLRNREFPTVYYQTVGICEKYNMKSLHLEKSHGELISFRTPIDGLTVYLRKSAELAQASQAEVGRDTLIQSINQLVKGYGHVTIDVVYPHYNVLNDLLKKHDLKTMAGGSHAAETERLLLLETEIKATPTVQDAITALGLTPVFTHLFAANHEYDNLFRAHIAHKSETPHIDVVGLRRDTGKSMTQFFDAVQYSAYVYEEVDYTPLVNELRTLNQYYIQQLKARATRRKNGKVTDEEPPIEPPQGN